MSTLRRSALNPVKGEKSLKIGVAAKRKRAGWDLECISERYSDSRNKMRLSWEASRSPFDTAPNPPYH